MSYHGFVVCRCYQDGKTIAPPFPELVILDDDGIGYNISEDNLKTDEEWNDYFDKNDLLDQWKRTACPHEDMEISSEHICNSAGMSGFRNYLFEQGGNEKFPTLSKELPTHNGGAMSASQSEKALAELQLLKSLQPKIDKIVLRETKSHDVIMIGDYNETIRFGFFDYNKSLVLDSRGFFILEKKKIGGVENEYILFHAKEFSTVVVDEKRVAFIDEHAKGLNIGSYFPIQLGENKPAETEIAYEVVKEEFDGDDYWMSVIESLENLCKASIETQNPVHWC
ncbi:hypothetical protein [Soonwooa sp.]|uniref:hypothetical protein n=1 Tax=Soonwooa sp. TaxID=1938592 RepID=UPI00261BCB12|nr:hypothetical protein [Soonwooa sp.]